MAWRLAMVYLGLGLYVLDLAVGLAAQLGARFGTWHHVLYAVVFAAAIAGAIASFHPALLITLAALAAMPLLRPHTPWHPLVAMIGLCGYLGALTGG